MELGSSALPGVLVDIYHTEGELCAWHHCSVLARILPGLATGEAAKEFEFNKARLETIEPSQKWCVG